MLAKSETCGLLLIVISAVTCQINGDFWWLNNNIIKSKHGRVRPPKFDDVNEMDTDETAKVLFKDIVFSANNNTGSNFKKHMKSQQNDTDARSAIYFRDETNFFKPFNPFDGSKVNLSVDSINNISSVSTSSSKIKSEDEFRFVFPSDSDLLWKESNTLDQTADQITSYDEAESFKTTNSVHDALHAMPSDDSICTFIQKSECILNEGIVNTLWMEPDMVKIIFDNNIICCILPITTSAYSKIIFPGTDWNTKRQKRSNNNNMDPALKQRNTLMRRKQNTANLRIRTTTPSMGNKVTHKIVNSDEYSADPYWNIKNPGIRNSDVPIYQDSDSGYVDGSPDQDDNYAEELPKPGLTGLYSDHKKTSWTHNNNKGFSYDFSDSVEEEFEPSLGYSNIDPRLDHHLTSKPFRRTPAKVTAVLSQHSVRNSQRQKGQKISFHSNPDFQVLQGFKLLNFVQHKNRNVRKTPQISEECNKNTLRIKDKPSKYENNFDFNSEDEIFKEELKQKLFDECHKTKEIVDDCEKGKDEGVVKFGRHPWILIVVSTNSQQDILCYATLVHARVAVSSADCVYRQASGAISIIAGVQNLDKDLVKSQRRMVSIYLDQDYEPGDLEKSLALLYWKRSLILDATVQPTCLEDLHDMTDCVYVGWGGYDQEMRTDLHWQRASILLTPQKCTKQLSKLQVNDALCAAVKSRGTVTGVGGPLLCKIDDRWSTVGVVVGRDDVVVLLPPQDWVVTNMASLRIQ